jgi:hypothetical protein
MRVSLEPAKVLDARSLRFVFDFFPLPLVGLIISLDERVTYAIKGDSEHPRLLFYAALMLQQLISHYE